MARPRLPAAKAEATGAALINAGRFADRKAPKGTRPLGEPYAKMNEAEKEQWAEFARDLPWLNSSHRVILRMACKLTVDMDGDEFGVSKAQALSSILSKLGATPVDETRITHGDEGDEDPADAYFGRPN